MRRGALASGFVVFALGVGLAFLPAAGGCSSDQSRCKGTLASFAGVCAATFDGTVGNLPVCPVGTVAQAIVSCGSLNVIQYSSPGGIDCIYDSATHQLVGARAGTDIPTSCPGGYTATAGRAPDDSCFKDPVSSVACFSDPSSDGGAD